MVQTSNKLDINPCHMHQIQVFACNFVYMHVDYIIIIMATVLIHTLQQS